MQMEHIKWHINLAAVAALILFAAWPSSAGAAVPPKARAEGTAALYPRIRAAIASGNATRTQWAVEQMETLLRAGNHYHCPPWMQHIRLPLLLQHRDFAAVAEITKASILATPSRTEFVAAFQTDRATALLLNGGACVAGGQPRTRGYSTEVLSTALRRAVAVTALARKWQASSNAGAAKQFFRLISAADKEWARVGLILRRCRALKIIVPSKLKLDAEVQRLLFISRYGPLTPLSGSARLLRALHGWPRLGYTLSVRVALQLGREAGMLGPGEEIEKLPDGKWSKPVWCTPTLAEERLSRQDQLASLRYALRAARASPASAVTAYMLWHVPWPVLYSRKLVGWGMLYFYAHYRAVRDWSVYFTSHISLVVSDAAFNIRRNYPRAMAEINAGRWRPPAYSLPAWKELKMAVDRTGRKREKAGR